MAGGVVRLGIVGLGQQGGLYATPITEGRGMTRAPAGWSR
jgi:hypothetical protein